MSNKINELIEYITNLPLNSIIYWGDNSASVEEPFCGEWVDIVVPEIQNSLGWNWVWTIENPMSYNQLKEEFVLSGGDADTFIEEHARASETIFLESNVQIHGIWSKETHWWENQVALPYSELPPLSYLNDINYDFRPGWTVEFISEELSNWCLNFCNREDIIFVWSAEINDAFIAEVQKEYKNASFNKENYLLYEDSETGQKIKATSQVMDTLLEQDFDTSSAVMEFMKDVLNNHNISE